MKAACDNIGGLNCVGNSTNHNIYMLGVCFVSLVHNLKSLFYFTKVFAHSPENTTSSPI